MTLFRQIAREKGSATNQAAPLRSSAGDALQYRFPSRHLLTLPRMRNRRTIAGLQPLDFERVRTRSN